MRAVQAGLSVVLAATLLAAGCGAQAGAGVTSATSSSSGTSPITTSASSTSASSTSASSTSASSTSGSSTSESSSTSTSSTSSGGPAVAVSTCVDTTLAKLSPTARAAQVLLVGVNATNPTADSPALVALSVGGIFLRGRVAGGTALQTALATAQRNARNRGTLPLLVAADEEGGAVQTVTGGSIPPFPAALVEGRWSTPTLRRTTTGWATTLRSLGVNLDLAPVADTVPASLGTANPPIGRYQREYGMTPAVVSRAMGIVVPAMKAARVGATLKHFPGLGRVLYNTDTSAKAVDTTTTATDPYLQPFVAGMQAGATALMVSSALYPKLDARNPAMWSHAVVTDLLQGRLGWRGLVLSDDLGQAVAAQSKPVGTRAVAFLGAGGDLVLTVVPSQAATMRAVIAAQAAAKASWRTRLDDAVRHVLAAKIALGLISC